MSMFGKILVIDDDPDIGLMMQMMLTYKGYNVTLLEKVDNLDELLAKENIDLIFMDMLLSGINGMEVCSKIKANTAFNHIPIIMMSAHPDAAKICLEAGANDFISKPFDTAIMLQKVERLLRK